MKNLTLVMPAKNEAECLPTVLEELKNFECKKIIVIPRNDLNTQNVVKNLNCKILLQDSDGYGNALIEGINTVETEFFCIFNADHSFDPKYLDGMLHDLKNNYDFLFNSRYEKEGGSEDDTFLTYIGNKIFTLLCNILFRLNISDVLFTYVMGKTSDFKLLELKSKDFSFCVAFLNSYCKDRFFDFPFGCFFSSDGKNVSCELLSYGTRACQFTFN